MVAAVAEAVWLANAVIRHRNVLAVLGDVDRPVAVYVLDRLDGAAIIAVAAGSVLLFLAVADGGRFVPVPVFLVILDVAAAEGSFLAILGSDAPAPAGNETGDQDKENFPRRYHFALTIVSARNLSSSDLR